ncbi:MAG: 23S rRNA (guanosine(2251)-2'-O)-methyltransferase RlmB [Polyangiaceae bacterium]|nr:23S rRNA (guanosine(2251)-2'-O)-methyltransferase RlmB [Polyangiaceae bacterium]
MPTRSRLRDRSLPRSRRPRRTEGHVKRLLTGPRFVAEGLRTGGRAEVHVVYVESLEAHPDVVRLASERGVPVELRSTDALDRLADGLRHQGVVAIAGAYPYLDLHNLREGLPPSPLLVALDEVTDPHNFGAIIRSALAFGASGVIIPKHRSAPVTAVVVRASAGATEHVRIARVTNLQRALVELADASVQVVGLAGDGDVEVGQLGPAPGGRCLVVGSEGYGMRRLVRERCDVIAKIPLGPDVESLNASVAAGIALYEAARSMRG